MGLHAASAGLPVKNLDSGQIASSLTTEYTVPASTVTELTNLLLYNTNTSTETITVAINNGSDRTIATVVLDTLEYASLDLSGVALTTGWIVKLGTTTASKVNFFLSGIERAA